MCKRITGNNIDGNQFAYTDTNVRAYAVIFIENLTYMHITVWHNIILTHMNLVPTHKPGIIIHIAASECKVRAYAFTLFSLFQIKSLGQLFYSRYSAESFVFLKNIPPGTICFVFFCLFVLLRDGALTMRIYFLIFVTFKLCSQLCFN